MLLKVKQTSLMMKKPKKFYKTGPWMLLDWDISILGRRERLKVNNRQLSFNSHQPYPKVPDRRLYVCTMEQLTLKNVNNCLNTNIYSYLEASGG